MPKRVLEDGRTVFISGALDDEMDDARREIRELVLADAGKPIRLVINSDGGSVIGANAVLDELDHVRQDDEADVTFIGVVEGWACSAALTILQGCDRRIAGSHSVLMAHGTRGGVRGDIEDRSAYEHFIGIIHTRMAKLYARRSRSTLADWLDRFRTSHAIYYSAKDALEEGLIDEISGS